MAVLRSRSSSGGESLEEIGAIDLMQAITSGSLSAEQLVKQCVARIGAIDRRGPRLNSVIELNPEAAALARALDAERRAGHVRGPPARIARAAQGQHRHR